MSKITLSAGSLHSIISVYFVRLLLDQTNCPTRTYAIAFDGFIWRRACEPFGRAWYLESSALVPSLDSPCSPMKCFNAFSMWRSNSLLLQLPILVVVRAPILSIPILPFFDIYARLRCTFYFYTPTIYVHFIIGIIFSFFSTTGPFPLWS